MIIDGKTLANEYMASLQHGFAEYGKPVRLSLIAVHPDDVVQRYMRAKQRFGERVGVEVVVHTVTQPMSQHDLEALIVNVAKNSDGVVLQLPVRGYDTSALLAAIPIEKDVDVLSVRAYDAWIAGNNQYTPPVAAAVRFLLHRYDIVLREKSIVIVGYGALVGKPVAALFHQEGLSYSVITAETSVQERTKLLAGADVIIAGAGVPHHISSKDVAHGVVIIDAGTSESAGVLRGDVNPDVADKAAYAALVPGGIGPLTVALLYQNLLYAVQS